MLTLKQKSENFTPILESAAKSLGCAFFEDSGEGNEKETETMLLEDISGWLIPISLKNEFEATRDRHDLRWDEYFAFAEWRIENDEVVIDFKKYPIYHDVAVAENAIV